MNDWDKIYLEWMFNNLFRFQKPAADLNQILRVEYRQMTTWNDWTMSIQILNKKITLN